MADTLVPSAPDRVAPDRGLLGIWYDLDPADERDYLDWLHREHLPREVKETGILWAAHYEAIPVGERFEKHVLANIPSVAKQAGPGGFVPRRYLLLLGAPTYETFYTEAYLEREAKRTEAERAMFARRKDPVRSLYAEVSRHEGPAARSRRLDLVPAPVLQVGRIDVPPEKEEHFSAWYAQDRFPSFTRLPGAVAARRHLAVEGPSKWLIFYEFESAEARERGFLPVEESERPRTIHPYVLQAPGSPGVYRRVWPEG